MKTGLPALLLSIFLLFSSFAMAEALPEVPEGWEPVNIADLVTPEMKEMDAEDDRAGGFFSSDGPTGKATADQVTIQDDGSFEIISGTLRLAGPQPFGWVYFTQSFQAHQEIYSKNPDLLQSLLDFGVHLFLQNTADDVKAFVYMKDDMGLLSLIADGRDLESAMQTVGLYQKVKFGSNVKQSTFCGLPYLVVTDITEGVSIYETVVGDIPVVALVYYNAGFSDLFERFLEETVLSELSLTSAV